MYYKEYLYRIVKRLFEGVKEKNMNFKIRYKMYNFQNLNEFFFAVY